MSRFRWRRSGSRVQSEDDGTGVVDSLGPVRGPSCRRSSRAAVPSSPRFSWRFSRATASKQVVAAGDVLFADGDETYDLVVVLEGVLEIVEHYGQPDETTIVTYGPFEFLGEMGLLTGQHAYLTAVAISARPRPADPHRPGARRSWRRSST